MTHWVIDDEELTSDSSIDLTALASATVGDNSNSEYQEGVSDCSDYADRCVHIMDGMGVEKYRTMPQMAPWTTRCTWAMMPEPFRNKNTCMMAVRHGAGGHGQDRYIADNRVCLES